MSSFRLLKLPVPFFPSKLPLCLGPPTLSTFLTPLVHIRFSLGPENVPPYPLAANQGHSGGPLSSLHTASVPTPRWFGLDGWADCPL